MAPRQSEGDRREGSRGTQRGRPEWQDQRRFAPEDDEREHEHRFQERDFGESRGSFGGGSRDEYREGGGYFGGGEYRERPDPWQRSGGQFGRYGEPQRPDAPDESWTEDDRPPWKMRESQGSWGPIGRRRDESRPFQGSDYGSGRAGGWGDTVRVGPGGYGAVSGVPTGEYTGGMIRSGSEAPFRQAGYGYGDRLSGGGYSPRQQGPDFRGRGPKGYQRSDERLKEMICERLTDDPVVDASDISIVVREGEVTLEGSVPDRQTKHRAEDLVEACGCVQEIHNQLRVARTDGARRESGRPPDAERPERT